TYVLEVKHPASATKVDFKWKPPNEGCLKLNVDALVSPGASFVGVGVVIRDASGAVRAASSKRLVGSFDILTT
ncbi:hypothetical protein TorRG33x02_182970, partial [Trema orientale]